MIPKKQISLKTENFIDLKPLILMLGILNGKLDEMINQLSEINKKSDFAHKK